MTVHCLDTKEATCFDTSPEYHQLCAGVFSLLNLHALLPRTRNVQLTCQIFALRLS